MIDPTPLIPPGLAILLDLTLGEPPNRVHPVAAIGSLLLTARRHLPTRGRLIPLVAGGGLMVAGLAAAVVLGHGIEQWLARLPQPAGWVLEAIALKSLFSIRGLIRAARSVERTLQHGDLNAARTLAAWHLVGRPTGDLDAPRLAAAAIESVAENASDSVVAPLLFYALAGLPGALAYRVINTADSILGYRDAEREWLGKVPARLDDLVNIVPSRITALALLLAAPGVGGSLIGAARIWRRDAGVTASPNAGQPMSVAAGALGVELEKVGHYRLGAGLRLPAAADIDRAIRLFLLALMLAAGPLAGLRVWAGAGVGR